MKNNYFNSFKVILVGSFLSIMIAEITSSNFILLTTPKNAFLIPLIFLLFLLLLGLFLSRKTDNILKEVMHNWFLRIIILVYTLVSLLIYFISTLTVITEWFYINTPTILIIITFVLGIVILSSIPPNTIINIGFYMVIIIFFVNMIKFLSINKDITFWLREIDFKIDKPLSLVSCLYVYLDIILFYLITLKRSPALSKKSYLIMVSVIVLFSVINILEMSFYFAPEVISKITYPAIYGYKLYPGNKFFESSSLLLLINSICSLLLKGALNVYLIRILLKIKRKNINLLIMMIILSILVYCLFNLNLINDTTIVITGYFLTCLILIFTFYLIFKKRRSKPLIN